MKTLASGLHRLVYQGLLAENTAHNHAGPLILPDNLLQRLNAVISFTNDLIFGLVKIFLIILRMKRASPAIKYLSPFISSSLISALLQTHKQSRDVEQIYHFLFAPERSTDIHIHRLFLLKWQEGFGIQRNNSADQGNS